MTKQLKILHISDLHIGKDNNFDRSTVLDPLIERVKKDIKEGLNPELVFVTGDIAFKGVKKEYDQAKKFLADLLKELKLPDQSLFIVPGNHDVNRKKYRPKDVPAYENMKELNDELGNKEYRKDLLKGMTEYFKFIKTYPHMKPINDNLIPFVTSYMAECKKNVGLVGLNSAWMCREKNTKIGEVALGQYQIKTAIDFLNKKKDDFDLVICAFHHPLNWLWTEDKNLAKKHLKDKVILCGHLHDAGGGWYNELDCNYYLFQAGTTYLNKEKWPERYHYLTYDWDDKKITLDFRRYSRKKGIWVVDSETGEDGKKEFYIEKSTPKKDKSSGQQPLPEIPKTYLEWIKSNYGHMDADKLYGKGKAFPLSLPEIFIPLYSYKPGETPPKKKKIVEKRKPDDIEQIISESDYLIIEGQAGSGKTTLLKHMAYCLAAGKSNECKINGTNNLLPLLIQLKDLDNFFSGSLKASAPSAAWCFL
jgi:predicted MPP superfamily phosphohydrolase